MLIEMLAAFFEDPGLFISCMFDALIVIGSSMVICNLLACLG